MIPTRSFRVSAILSLAFFAAAAMARDAAITTSQRARIRLSNGQEVPGSIVVTSLDETGVRCIIDGRYRRYYRPGQVRSVSTAAGAYVSDARSGGFRFQAHADRGSAAKQRDAEYVRRWNERIDATSYRPQPARRNPGVIYPDDSWRTYQTGKANGWDMDTAYAIAAMNKEQAAALKRVAIQQGYDWDRLSLRDRLAVARKILTARPSRAPARNASGTPAKTTNDEGTKLLLGVTVAVLAYLAGKAMSGNSKGSPSSRGASSSGAWITMSGIVKDHKGRPCPHRKFCFIFDSLLGETDSLPFVTRADGSYECKIGAYSPKIKGVRFPMPITELPDRKVYFPRPVEIGGRLNLRFPQK